MELPSGVPRAHRNQPQFLLYEIDVRPEYGNQGAGGALLQRFVAEALPANGFEVWTFTNSENISAIAMYPRHGLIRPNQDDVMVSLVLDSVKNE